MYALVIPGEALLAFCCGVGVRRCRCRGRVMSKVFNTSPLRYRVWQAPIVILLLTYAPTMNVDLSALHCRAPHKDTDERWLVADMSVVCVRADGSTDGAYVPFQTVATV